jgi:hypothetical protein
MESAKVGSWLAGISSFSWHHHHHHHPCEVFLGSTVSASNSLFKSLPSRLCPFGLQFNIIFAILLLFVPVTCRNQFDLHLLSFSSIGFTLISSKISSFPSWLKKMYPAVLLKNLMAIDVVCVPFLKGPNFAFPANYPINHLTS